MHDQSAAEAPVDVDAVLRQLKQAKDKELRLRAEKERVRKELGALRTGDLWTREAATQRELKGIQARRRALQDRETAEREQLNSLDDELREKEVSIQKRRRQPLDASSAIKQAASSIVASVALTATDTTTNMVSPSTQHFLTMSSSDKREPMSSVGLPATNMDDVAQTGNPTRVRRYPTNQESEDAVTKLAFSIDLEKQQSRIKRLEQQLEESTAIHLTGRHKWDLPSATAPQDRSQLERSKQTMEFASLTVGAELDRLEENSAVSAPNGGTPSTMTSQAPSIQTQTQHSPQAADIPRDPNAARQPVGSWTGQLPQSISSQSFVDPRCPFPVPYPLVAPVPMFPSAMMAPALFMYAPPTVAPMLNPSTYAPCGYSSPFGALQVGYPTPGFSQPPLFAHGSSFLSQSSQFTATPTLDQDEVLLQRQLDALRNREQQTNDDKEFAKVQDLLTGLQHQVTQLTRSSSADSLGEKTDATPRTSALAETGDSGLKSIKRQHLEAVLKVRNERDLLEEQDKARLSNTLEEMQERVEKRREERKRDGDRDAWVAKQKQELMALRLQRALAKMDMSKASGGAILPNADTRNRPYDPDAGVLLCWDYVSGLLPAVEKTQLTFAVYDGKIARSPIKSLISKECESEGPTHKRAIFAANRRVKPLPASEGIVVVIEVSSVTSANADSKSILRRLGWAAVELFGHDRGSELEFASGWFKVGLLTTPMPDPTKVLVRGSSPTEVAGRGDVTVHVRIIHGEMEDQVQNAVVDPDVHAGQYQPPQTSQRILQCPDEAASSPQPLVHSSTGSQLLCNRKLPTAETAGVVLDRNSSSNQPSPSQDFLDVEKLRLLSSSVTTRPPSESIRPRSTLSAIPRNRIGADAVGTLPVVSETCTFDDLSPTSPWIRVDKSLDRHRRVARKLFHSGDAFDVYVDGARFLPDNVTITKVTIAALHADRSKISASIADSNSQVAVPTSDACSPMYNMYVEYREKVFDPTLTLVIRIDTLERRTKQSVIVGYALFPVFLDTDTHAQPTRPNGVQLELNCGAFQLPLHTNALVADTATLLSAVTGVANIPRLPCATLLIRVKPAIMSEDGLQVLSRKTVPPPEWTILGLEEPVPLYHLGEYDSTASEPTPLEIKIYQLRDINKRKQRSRTVQQALQAMGLDSAHDVTTLFPAKPSMFMDLQNAFHYQPAIGFRVSIDGLHNVKVKAGSFCRVMYSVVPPGAFYQTIRLANGVQFTTMTDWTSLPSSPEFRDGYVSIRDLPADPRMVLVIDVRAVTKNAKTNIYGSQPLAWSFFPVLNDTTGSVAAGSFQIPLFTGDVKLGVLESSTSLSALMEDIAAERKKTVLPFMDGASVFVRLEDPQVPITIPSQPLIGAAISKMIPVKAISRYQYDSAKVALAKKKTPLSKQLPPGFSEKQLDTEINEAFATEMGLHHL